MMVVVVVVVVAMMMMMMMIEIMIINNFLNGVERYEDGWKLCRLLLKICPKRPNFVGFSEKKSEPLPPPPPFENLLSLEGCEWEMERSRGPSFPPWNDLFWNTSPVLRGPQQWTRCVQTAFWATSFPGFSPTRPLERERERDPFLSLSLQGAGRREPWERGCFLGRLYLHTYFT